MDGLSAGRLHEDDREEQPELQIGELPNCGIVELEKLSTKDTKEPPSHNPFAADCRLQLLLSGGESSRAQRGIWECCLSHSTPLSNQRNLISDLR